MKPDFIIEFNKLKNNNWEYESKKPENFEDTYYDRLKHMHINAFRTAVDAILDNDNKFPTINRLRSTAKTIAGSNINRTDYEYCNVCKGLGSLTKLISFKYDKHKNKLVKDWRWWTIGLKSNLGEKTGEQYYDYNYLCRCQKGEDLYISRNKECAQLTAREFADSQLKPDVGRR